MKLTGAQILIEKLVEHDATDIFGYPGGTVLPIYDELYKNSHRINHIITAHEQGASFAADGYARVKGKAGVVIATSGPGATNLITGIANAYLDSVPLIAITGNVPQSLSGKDSFQEVDILSVTLPIVKHSYVVTDIAKLSEIIDEAFEIANSGRKGPVVIDIPKNIQIAEYDYERKCQEPENLNKESEIFDIKEAVIAIEKSQRPFIYAGGGIISAKAEKELQELAKKIDAPIGLSMMGLTAVPTDNHYNLGMCGMHGKYTSTIAQDKCDLIIALGVRFSDRATGDIEVYTKGKTVIHVDIDLAEIEKNIPSKINIVGDVKEVLKQLIDNVSTCEHPNWMEEIQNLKYNEPTPSSDELNPKTLLENVEKIMPEDTVVTTDVGQHQMWTTLYYKFKKPSTLLTSGGLGAMGYGFGAAIGACIANHRKPTLFVTGDGSFGMNLNEFATAVSQNLPILIVLMNNNALGMVRQWQTMFYEKRYSQTTLNRHTDFTKLAEAFGAKAYKINNLQELKDTLDNLKLDGPTILDCTIDSDFKVFPIIPPGGSAKTIITKEE